MLLTFSEKKIKMDFSIGHILAVFTFVVTLFIVTREVPKKKSKLDDLSSILENDRLKAEEHAQYLRDLQAACDQSNADLWLTLTSGSLEQYFLVVVLCGMGCFYLSLILKDLLALWRYLF